ncbi:MAG TPA: hypothetical protein PLS69_14205 [Terricaulis sp.]|nr:hypothetical protein [Terricaulis sp.]
MRALVLMLAVFCTAAATADAQTRQARRGPERAPPAQSAELPDDGRFQPEWDRRPVGGDFARHYPADALDRAVPGLVQLCCVPLEDRTLECRSAFSWPADYPFDRAAEAIARRFRMTPESYAACRATPDAWLQIPISSRHISTGADFDAFADEVRTRSQGLCRPDAAPAEAPAP